MRLADSPYGHLDYVNGELLNTGGVDDPVAYRGGSAFRALVKWSGDAVRADGTRDELVLDQYKRDERYGPAGLVGEKTTHLRAPGTGEAGTLIETVRFDGITYHVPIIAKAGLSVGPPELLRSADGRFRLHLQGDGNLVLYDDQVGGPYWATNTVLA